MTLSMAARQFDARTISTWLMSAYLCLTLASGQPKVINVGVMVPFSGHRPWVLHKTRPALEVAMLFVNSRSDLLPRNYTLCLLFRDSKGSVIDAHLAALELHSQRQVHLFIGAVNAHVVAQVAMFSGRWGVPVISATPFLDAFYDRRDFAVLTRIMGSYGKVGEFVVRLLEHFKWKVVSLFYSHERGAFLPNRTRCHFTLFAVHVALKTAFKQNPVHALDCDDVTEDFTEHLREASRHSRIMLLCTCPDSLREIMIKAHELNFDNGEYVFVNINVGSTNDSARPWYRANDTDVRNQKARQGYEALLTITVRKPKGPEYYTFTEEVRRMAIHLYENQAYGEEEVNVFAVAFYEALILYAIALNETLAAGGSASDAAAITGRMWNRTFMGVTGTVSIDPYGDRNPDYSLWDLNPATDQFEVVANYFGHRKQYEPVPGRPIDWGGGRTSAPDDNPMCGYDGSDCPTKDLFPAYGIVILVSAIVLLIFIVILIIVYKWKDRVCWMNVNPFLYNLYTNQNRDLRLTAELAQMTWLVDWWDILFGENRKKPFHRRSSTVSSLSVDTMLGHMDFLGNKQVFTKVGSYNGVIVCIKPFHNPDLVVDREVLLEVKHVKDLHHDHIIRFIGACIEVPNQCILSEYCKKGSLQDVLESDEITLDWMFRYSIMQDIARGMAYLHTSEIKSHGRLKSTNCVIDSRFVVKITDFGLHRLRDSPEIMDHNSFAYHESKLWTAPELLRSYDRLPEGTKKGDVYSFAIICQEIVYREGVFYLSNLRMSPNEKVERVIERVGSAFRPTLNTGDCPSVELAEMICSCWEEDPKDRPGFYTLKSIIRKLNKEGDKGNILDNLLSRMEQYANNLEELVDERTEDYLEQKKRAEDLLCSMLPKSVAYQLIRGETVTAETFESVTIFFSDICGFTEMSAKSTPMQIVDFLNDLYTLFDSTIEHYDVYKVETIGDAYMVVSGMPVKNGNLHVREISRMSLALLERVHKFHIRHRPGEQLKIRIGLHTGGVCAGVVGMKMPRYCLFGDTVNTASRMESHGHPLKIHISPDTKSILDLFGSFIVKPRGTVEIKGKGPMATYWLVGEDGLKGPSWTVQQQRHLLNS
ncbi:atrial natriuretic peptide receptor 1-like [Gigantopelta aegis]|uniref:atrial natriuretic peptide receptor 1-like n=1 Tax=Gigantopelta aegis TaxID=1735272 RepID=UPI001B88C182|nr:atrial natriuretic peptide receptor 1-like [Gigantopelta aegis]